MKERFSVQYKALIIFRFKRNMERDMNKVQCKVIGRQGQPPSVRPSVGWRLRADEWVNPLQQCVDIDAAGCRVVGDQLPLQRGSLSFDLLIRTKNSKQSEQRTLLDSISIPRNASCTQGNNDIFDVSTVRVSIRMKYSKVRKFVSCV